MLKPNQTLFERSYLNLASLFFYKKIKYFNDFKKQNFSTL